MKIPKFEEIDRNLFSIKFVRDSLVEFSYWLSYWLVLFLLILLLFDFCLHSYIKSCFILLFEFLFANLMRK